MLYMRQVKIKKYPLFPTRKWGFSVNFLTFQTSSEQQITC
jgi:hypothetical protein